MATVHLQRNHAKFTDGEQTVIVDARTVGHIIDELERRYPGLGPLLRSASSVAINTEIVANGEFERVDDATHMHFIAKISGG